jgi:hypothetical protein
MERKPVSKKRHARRELKVEEEESTAPPPPPPMPKTDGVAAAVSTHAEVKLQKFRTQVPLVNTPIV